jgi:hypothetical protein
LENVPFFARGVAFGDIVSAQPAADGRLTVEDVVRHSGHSTFRILFDAELLGNGRVSEIMQQLVDAGGTYEKARANLWALDVADRQNVNAIQEKLQELAELKQLDYEEGYLA